MKILFINNSSRFKQEHILFKRLGYISDEDICHFEKYEDIKHKVTQLNDYSVVIYDNTDEEEMSCDEFLLNMSHKICGLKIMFVSSNKKIRELLKVHNDINFMVKNNNYMSLLKERKCIGELLLQQKGIH